MNKIQAMLFWTFALTIAITAAALDKTATASEYISALGSKDVSAAPDLKAPSLLGTQDVGGRPVIYVVAKALFSESEIARLKAIVDNKGKTAYSNKEGKYYFHNVALQKIPLSTTDDNSLAGLKVKAESMIQKLLGNSAGNFVFANAEMDSVLLDGEESPKLTGMTYRFTRKLNGRHIIDNTAYARVSFAGNAELCAFEIVNPVITPLRAADRMVKLDATGKRLQAYAEEKKTATKNGVNGMETILVNAITAEKGYDTYIAHKQGGQVLLIPNATFYCKYQLANGDSFKNWKHFCIDAGYTQNLEPDMIEGEMRR